MHSLTWVYDSRPDRHDKQGPHLPRLISLLILACRLDPSCTVGSLDPPGGKTSREEEGRSVVKCFFSSTGVDEKNRTIFSDGHWHVCFVAACEHDVYRRCRIHESTWQILPSPWAGSSCPFWPPLMYRGVDVLRKIVAVTVMLAAIRASDDAKIGI